MFILRRFVEQEIIVDESVDLDEPRDSIPRMLGWLILGFAGVGLGSYAVIESTISLSRYLGVSEYLISFFMLSIGTSLPELVVGVAAIRKRHFDLAVGDIIGSCIVDSTLAIGLGPIFFPIEVSGNIILRTGLYAAFVSTVVVAVLTWQSVNDKRSGLLFILLYLGSYLVPYFL
jgi:cation:H+ antiporter